MSKDNSSCLTDIIEIAVVVIIIMLIVSYCNRADSNKSLLDHTIEEVHAVKNHVDSVWNGEVKNEGEIKNEKAE